MEDLKITFTLSEKDVAHLRRLIRRATQSASGESETSILAGAEKFFKDARAADPPQYVLDRVAKLDSLVQMVRDEDYQIPPNVRKKVLGALAYLAHPADLIPDSIPGLGFLDDAIMVELIARDLRHEIWGYGRFCAYRDSAEQRPWTPTGKSSLGKKLAERRKQVRTEIQKRQTRDYERAKSKGGLLSRLW